MERRLHRLSKAFGADDAPGRLVIVTPNAWSDDDRDAWDRAWILHDTVAKDDLIEGNTGIRPTHRPGLVSVIVIPAPAVIEAADEATRAIWRERANARAWRT